MSNNYNKNYIITLSLIWGSSGSLFGYNNTIINILAPSYLKVVFKIDDFSIIQGNIIFMYSIGAIFGGLICSFIINYFGRRKSLIFFSFINFLNSLLFFSKNINFIYFAEFIVGVFVGIYWGVTNGIIGEYIPYEYKNYGIQTFSITNYSTYFLIYLFGYLFKDFLGKYWFIFISGNGIIELIRFFFLLFYLKDESPSYLYRKYKINGKTQIKNYFKKIYNNEKTIKSEFNKFCKEMENLIILNGDINIKDLIFKKNKKGFLLATYMNFSQQSVGVSIINYFSIIFFKKISNTPYFFTMLLGLAAVFGSLFNLIIIKFNKRLILINGSIIILILMISMIIADYYKFYEYLAYSLILYTFFFSISFGAVYFEYLFAINESEVMVISSSFRWISSSIFSKLTPFMFKHINIIGTYIVFIILLIIYIIIFSGYSVNINGKTKSEIKMNLLKKSFFSNKIK